MKIFVTILLAIILIPVSLLAQDPHRFDTEIQKFKEMDVPEGDNIVVFTGSSSIRFWIDVASDCSQWQAINTGFGGSQMSDLCYFLEDAVLKFKPNQVFIYEGDNDINDGKTPEAILETTREVTDKLLKALPELKIHYISAKPSPSRWQFKAQYEAFNALLKAYCESHPQLSYIDVWTPMINEKGRPTPHIFIEDSLHMNRKGYDLWRDVVCGGVK
ncbi:MAG: G-D-S-L family lipolytic protein [Flavobacteriaceae bacterium]|nr:G-D-S-L family lipolytic protein [Flavobacteriaceae bacterium]